MAADLKDAIFAAPRGSRPLHLLGLPTAPLRGAPRAIPVPSDYEAFRRYRAVYCRRLALRSAERVAVETQSATPPAESRMTRGLRRVDHAALGLMNGAVLALLPVAFSLLNGLT